MADCIKNLATASKLDITVKHKDSYQVENVLNCMFISNNCSSVRGTHERRWFYLTVLDVKKVNIS